MLFEGGVTNSGCRSQALTTVYLEIIFNIEVILVCEIQFKLYVFCYMVFFFFDVLKLKTLDFIQ